MGQVFLDVAPSELTENARSLYNALKIPRRLAVVLESEM